MANQPQFTDLGRGAAEREGAAIDASQHERPATVWVSRITGIVGGIILLVALFEWFFRHGHFRLILALFTVAMFCAILHSYVFEETRN
jgi:hypothetical protein